MSATEIRQRQDTDIPLLAAALVAVHQQDGYPVEGVGEPLTWLDLNDPLGVWTATLAGRPVGQVALTKPGPNDDAPRILAGLDATPFERIAVLGRLFISPDARGHALGRRLTETAMHAGRALERRVVLDVMAKDSAAIAIYDQIGWHRIGNFDHKYGDGQLEPAIAFVAP